MSCSGLPNFNELFPTCKLTDRQAVKKVKSVDRIVKNVPKILQFS
jgi:hypothetical protein